MRRTWSTEDRRVPCRGCGELYEPGLNYTSAYCRECHEARRALNPGRFYSSAKLIDVYQRALV